MIIRECSDRAHKSEPGRNRKGRRIPPEPDYGDSTQPAGNASSTIETIFREELRNGARLQCTLAMGGLVFRRTHERTISNILSDAYVLKQKLDSQNYSAPNLKVEW